MPDVIQKATHILSPKRWWMPVVALLVGGLITFLANWTGEKGALAGWWVNGVDPLITMSTLALAIFLWARAWVDELPKRLNIHFRYRDRYVLTCWEAPLAGEGDIRQWAQQIGRQMSGNRELGFGPYPAITSPTTASGPLGLRRVYTITIDLTTEPPTAGYQVWGPTNEDRAAVAVRPALPMTVEEILTTGTTGREEDGV